MSSHTRHEYFMKTAIKLARKGMGGVSPNPLVGAVLVKGGRIIGTGFHKCFGGPHAEINALQSAAADPRGADIYINLEPCCHHGKTPPCVDALITGRVRKVFIGMVDPNPAVSGKSIKKLTRAGIAVEIGLLENECRRLNESFIKYISQKIPFVILKAALTLDGKIASYTGDSKWITSEQSRKHAHRMRSETDAVMVGLGTIRADDPLLTVRLYKGAKKNPVRVVADSTLAIPLKSRLLQSGHAAETIIATSPHKARSNKAKTIHKMGATVLAVPLNKQRIDLPALLKQLAEKGITSVMIEGGSELNASALESGIVDKIMFYYAPKIVGGRKAVSAVGGEGLEKIAEAIKLHEMSIKRMGTDFLVEGYIVKS